MIHEPDRPGQYDWWTDIENFQGPVLDVLDELKRQGVIRFTGLGGTTAYEMAHLIETGKFDVVLTAFNYSLLWREAAREVLPAAKRQGHGHHRRLAAAAGRAGAALRRRRSPRRPRWLSSPRRAQYLALYRFLDELDMPAARAGVCVSSSPTPTSPAR